MDILYEQTYWITSQASPTPLRSLCKESRHFTLKKDTDAFESDHHKPSYFDFDSLTRRLFNVLVFYSQSFEDKKEPTNGALPHSE